MGPAPHTWHSLTSKEGERPILEIKTLGIGQMSSLAEVPPRSVKPTLSILWILESIRQISQWEILR